MLLTEDGVGAVESRADSIEASKSLKASKEKAKEDMIRIKRM
jgi:hypothetical protein